MIKSEDGIKRRGDFFWSVVDFSFEKDTIGHIFTGQYYGLHNHHKPNPTFNTIFNNISVISWLMRCGHGNMFHDHDHSLFIVHLQS
jgi:hypothetical protein